MENNYKELARQARIKVLGMVFRAGTSHIASNFSATDLAVVLYQNLKEGDEVVWSAGWKAALEYYFLAQQGKIPKEDLDKFPNPPYLGLAETTVPGVHVSGGSMGHGAPIAVGMALGKKRAKEDGTVFCIMSDGELNEGTTWESAALAHHHKLNNLVVLVDANKWQAMGKTKDVLDFEPIQDHWKGFGWETDRVDGHDYDKLETSITYPFSENPRVIICDTIKGKGVSFFEGHLLYHYKHVDAEEYKKALAELNA
mgnify:CR=1 FL=1